MPMNKNRLFGLTIIVHTHGWYHVCYVFIIVTVVDLANNYKIQRDCGYVAGNVDSLFTELSKQF